MGTYQQLAHQENLRRAYRWLQSNPDPLYKNFFRDTYAAYAAASDQSLRRLRRHLMRRDYTPGHASKIFVPKPSGILRPITLLSMNDQIVYQACANVIAEHLHPKNQAQPGKTIFGHVYAGKTSSFFYRRWTSQYQAFTKAITDHINRGNTWVADFDLAAFYESIDHHALRHFLRQIGIDDDFCDFFFECLRKWTSTNWPDSEPDIYHEHGIPQGPQASGIISECILKHIDKRGKRGRCVHYVRYVDDIKLFASNEQHLRRKLVSLDLASKEVGLFPQSSKINIRQTRFPEEEFKSVSIPPEPAGQPGTTPVQVRHRILELLRSRPLSAQSVTRIKYLLPGTPPHHSLNSKLIELVTSRPELAPNVARYFQRYRLIPKKAAEALELLLTTDWVYHAPHAELLMGTVANLPEPQRSSCLTFCYRRLMGIDPGWLQPQPTLKAAMAIWCIYHARLTFLELHTVFRREADWWVRQFILPYVATDHFGRPSLHEFLQDALQDPHPDVARMAASRLVDERAKIQTHKIPAHESAKLVFFEGGYLRTIGRPRSLVDAALAKIASEHYVSVEWRRILGSEHREAEELARLARKDYESNSLDACILQLDSLLDMIFRHLFTRVRPTATYPNYGCALRNPHLLSHFPQVCAAFTLVHDLRIQSRMAHPRHIRTGSMNRQLRHSQVRSIGPPLRRAFRELKGQGF